MVDQQEKREPDLKARVALLEKVIASLLINRRDPFRRGWVKEIFRKEHLPEDTEWSIDDIGRFSADVSREEMDELENRVSELATVEKLAAEIVRLRLDYIEMMVALSEAEALADVPMRRVIQTSVYISGNSKE